LDHQQILIQRYEYPSVEYITIKVVSKAVSKAVIDINIKVVSKAVIIMEVVGKAVIGMTLGLFKFYLIIISSNFKY